MDVRDMTLACCAGRSASSSRRYFLVGGTLRENIAYGHLDALFENIHQAARFARLDDMIAALPTGLDIVIGEGLQEMKSGGTPPSSMQRPRASACSRANSSACPATGPSGGSLNSCISKNWTGAATLPL